VVCQSAALFLLDIHPALKLIPPAKKLYNPFSVNFMNIRFHYLDLFLQSWIGLSESWPAICRRSPSHLPAENGVINQFDTISKGVIDGCCHYDVALIQSWFIFCRAHINQSFVCIMYVLQTQIGNYAFHFVA
jgi:hypothetical protein